jgi:hypothetical protein
MFLYTKVEKNQYTRLSKLGVEHSYYRKKIVAIFRCDNCDVLFERDLKHIHKKRLSNNYFHCCKDCDVKKFAQRKGVERKKIWDMPASLDWPVSKF